MTIHNYHLFTLGLGLGLVASYAINAQASARAIQKVSKVAQAVYDSLTFANVATFSLTSIGVTGAAAFTFNSIKILFELSRTPA